MKGHGSQFDRKMEAAIAALLTQRNVEEAARSIGISANTLLKWMKERIRCRISGSSPRRVPAVNCPAAAGLQRRGDDSAQGDGRTRDSAIHQSSGGRLDTRPFRKGD